MSNASRVVLRNSIFGVASELIAGTLFFATFILIARALGTSEFGIFSYILAFVGIFQLLADFGLTNILVREITRDLSRVTEIVSTVRPLAWIFSSAIFVLIAAIGYPLSPTPQAYTATILLGLAVLATFHSFSYGSVCRAFEEMGFNAIGNVTHKILLILLVALAIKFDTGIIGAAAAMLIANIYQWVFFYLVVRVRYVSKIRWHYDFAYWRYLLVEAAPIGIAMVFRRASQHVNTLILTALSSNNSVGLFTVAYKIVQMLDMIPFTLSIPLFPQFVRLARESKEQLFRVLTHAIRIFMIIAAPIVIWTVVMARVLIELLFGTEYIESTTTLQVLAVSLLFLFFTALYSYLFSALDRQRFYTTTSGLCLLANVIMGFILIPYYGHLGAAIATLIAEAVFCVCGLWLLYSLGYRIAILRIVGTPFGLALIASAVLIWSTTQDSSLITVIASLFYMALYFILIIATGTLNTSELALMRSLIKRNQTTPEPIQESA